MSEQECNFNFWSLLIGLFYVFLGMFAFNNPISSTSIIVYFIAFLLIFKGIMHFTVFSQVRKLASVTNWWMVVIGVIDVLIGVFLLFNVTSGIVALPFVFASWFIIDSIFAIFAASPIRKYNKGKYWFTIVMSILSIILGFMLLYNPFASLITIAMLLGAYFIVNGIIHIIQAF